MNNYMYNVDEGNVHVPQVYPNVQPVPMNRFVYFNQYPSNSVVQEIPKVLVNPHFKKTVFINPNFKKPVQTTPKIHINPKVTSIHINPNVQKIHVNPNVLKNISCVPNVTATVKSVENTKKTVQVQGSSNRTVVSTRTKIIRVPEGETSVENRRKRRNSVRSKYKIIKSSDVQSPNYGQQKFASSYNPTNIYKVDNTTNITKTSVATSSNAVKNARKRYVYINRFTSISEIARTVLFKQSCKIHQHQLLNISGVMYKKSPNSLRRALDSNRKENVTRRSIGKLQSCYKLIKKSTKAVKLKNDRRSSLVKQYKIIRSVKSKRKNVPVAELRKCNIPCPIFRKYGKCRRQETGKCFRKHDPDQIILCTRFLQGACIKKNCLLSHKVSHEKMPTCKYYLEGMCSRDDCPYLHVRINPKADICRDFLEGFCKKASGCNKRHQLLCPDYEKNGSCPKKRCPYPHGNMVRKDFVFNKVAKKYSKKKENCDNNDKAVVINNASNETKLKATSACAIQSQSKDEKVSVGRYYADNVVNEKKVETDVNSVVQSDCDGEADCDKEVPTRSRPKLGVLPAFIPLFERHT